LLGALVVYNSVYSNSPEDLLFISIEKSILNVAFTVYNEVIDSVAEKIARYFEVARNGDPIPASELYPITRPDLIVDVLSYAGVLPIKSCSENNGRWKYIYCSKRINTCKNQTERGILDLRGESAVSSKVKSILELKTSNCNLLVAVKNSLSPDNTQVTRDMSIRESIVRYNNSLYTYRVEVEVVGDLLHALKRTSSTINELLLILKSIEKTLNTITTGSIQE